MESKIIHFGKLKCHPGKWISVALVRFDEWSKILMLNPDPYNLKTNEWMIFRQFCPLFLEKRSMVVYVQTLFPFLDH